MCPSGAISHLSYPTFLVHFFHVHVDVGHVVWISLPLFFLRAEMHWHSLTSISVLLVYPSAGCAFFS